jgi:hypothetical protein
MYNFLKYREKFLNAVFYTDTDEFFKLVEEGGFSTLFTNDMKIFSNDALPIHYITICWDIILSKYNEFKDEYKQKVYEKKCKNDRIKEFFIKEQHLDMEHIPFQSYSGHFYSDDTDETAEDCLCCSLEDLQKAHYRQIDIDLYCYVCKFDFENVELLLKQGANPNVTFFEDTDNEMGNCFGRIGDECAFLECELRNVMFNEHSNQKPNVTGRDICDLIGLAAHEKMYSLLEKYDKN